MTDQTPTLCTVPDEEVTGVATLQFTLGGLFDGRPFGDRIHLVRMIRSGTPGPTLCGLDRFAPDAPGWSVGGGVRGPDDAPHACPNCVFVWTSRWPDVKPWGSTFADVFAAHNGSSAADR